uniref:Uncharacterized protein n=1 Tax=Arundo donax TaxID=35708 RepID=A0A0A9FPW6_ARUDO
MPQGKWRAWRSS